MKSFFRYPGGKAKFNKIILNELKAFGRYDEYREPFFGGGSIGLDMIADNSSRAWINDKDVGINSLWRSVASFPCELKTKVNNFRPSVDDFYSLKEFFLNDPVPQNDEDIVEIGFNKLAIHQISFSGLGVKSGGPLGGRNQTDETKYPIDCRWSPKSICQKIDILHNCFKDKQLKITHGDFSDLILDQSCHALIYLDPPYYDKGSQLYYHAFSDEDHIRLSRLLKETVHDWVLSYDDCEQIRDLYPSEWATIISIDANYTINNSTKKSELLIFNSRHIPVFYQKNSFDDYIII